MGLFVKAQEYLKNSFSNLPDIDNDTPGLQDTVEEVAKRLTDNDPYFHPNYLGHMSSYVCDVSQIAYFLAMQVNPNNHSYDGGRATSIMEQECIRQHAEMLGWRKFNGHLTSGGTIANLEALWYARELGATCIVASDASHYTHRRMASVLGMQYINVPTDTNGSMHIGSLFELLSTSVDPKRIVVVATMGTTLYGSLDPLAEIIKMRDKFSFYVHADAAYGGYFYLIRKRLSMRSCDALSFLSSVDSIVIDPHKHGLQAFGCGSVLINGSRNDIDTSVYSHESPYTYLGKSGLNIGETTLECSRPGAAAAALWATLDCYPLTEDSKFSDKLSKCHLAAIKLANLVRASSQFRLVTQEPNLDIVVFYLNFETRERISESSAYIYERIKKENYYIALAEVDLMRHGIDVPGTTMCIRVVLMKEEHLDVIDSFFHSLLVCADCYH